MGRTFLSFVCALVCAASIISFARAVPVPLHQYEFNGDLSDTQGGSAIASEGGAIGASTYRFDPEPRPGDYNKGLTLTSPGLTDPAVYSIEMRVNFDSLRNITPDSQPWIKLIDFKDQTVDDGYYLEDAGGFNGTGESSFLEFFGAEFAVTESPVALPQTWLHLVFTRDALGNVSAYANGAQGLSFVDTVGELAFAAEDNVMRFLQDDNVSPNYGPPGGPVYEATRGEIDYLRIYDSALSAEDVAQLISIPGDTDGDGVVGVIDLNNVRNNFGGAGLGDTDGDGVVNVNDLNNVRNNFGAGSAASNAPEPGSVTLGGVCAVALIILGRRSRATRRMGKHEA